MEKLLSQALSSGLAMADIWDHLATLKMADWSIFSRSTSASSKTSHPRGRKIGRKRTIRKTPTATKWPILQSNICQSQIFDLFRPSLETRTRRKGRRWLASAPSAAAHRQNCPKKMSKGRKVGQILKARFHLHHLRSRRWRHFRRRRRHRRRRTTWRPTSRSFVRTKLTTLRTYFRTKWWSRRPCSGTSTTLHRCSTCRNTWILTCK